MFQIRADLVLGTYRKRTPRKLSNSMPGEKQRGANLECKRPDILTDQKWRIAETCLSRYHGGEQVVKLRIEKNESSIRPMEEMEEDINLSVTVEEVDGTIRETQQTSRSVEASAASSSKRKFITYRLLCENLSGNPVPIPVVVQKVYLQVRWSYG